MKIDRIDLDEKVLVVAEIGNNHEGHADMAAKMIRLAAAAGADAVKFQTFRTEHLVSPADAERFKTLKRFELSTDTFRELKRVADDLDIIFLSTPFDIISAEFLNSLVPAFKIASGDNTFYPLIEKVAGFGKPIILSCGLADLRQLRRTKALMQDTWRGIQSDANLAVLHCVVNYPVLSRDINLGFIRILQDNLGCTTGYSDHSLGIDAAISAVACGARIIEKHFTLDKNYSDFRDHQLSANPDELKEMVDRIREMELLLGNREKRLLPCEEMLKSAVRRSIASARDINKGEVVQKQDITWIRPAGGYPPGQEAKVLDRRATRDIPAGSFLTAENIT